MNSSILAMPAHCTAHRLVVGSWIVQPVALDIPDACAAGGCVSTFGSMLRSFPSSKRQLHTCRSSWWRGMR